MNKKKTITRVLALQTAVTNENNNFSWLDINITLFVRQSKERLKAHVAPNPTLNEFQKTLLLCPPIPHFNKTCT